MVILFIYPISKNSTFPKHTTKFPYGTLVFTAKFPYGEISVRRNFLRRNILTAKFLYGEFSLRRNILRRNILRRNFLVPFPSYYPLPQILGRYYTACLIAVVVLVESVLRALKEPSKYSHKWRKHTRDAWSQA